MYFLWHKPSFDSSSLNHDSRHFSVWQKAQLHHVSRVVFLLMSDNDFLSKFQFPTYFHIHRPTLIPRMTIKNPKSSNQEMNPNHFFSKDTVSHNMLHILKKSLLQNETNLRSDHSPPGSSIQFHHRRKHHHQRSLPRWLPRRTAHRQISMEPEM